MATTLARGGRRGREKRFEFASGVECNGRPRLDDHRDVLRGPGTPQGRRGRLRTRKRSSSLVTMDERQWRPRIPHAEALSILISKALLKKTTAAELTRWSPLRCDSHGRAARAAGSAPANLNLDVGVLATLEVNGSRQKSMLLSRASIEHATFFHALSRAAMFFPWTAILILEWFPLHTEAALTDVDGLRSDDANLGGAVATVVAGIVEDASVVAPVAGSAAKRIFAIELKRPRERREGEPHYVAFRMREMTLELNSERDSMRPRRVRCVIAYRLRARRATSAKRQTFREEEQAAALKKNRVWFFACRRVRRARTAALAVDAPARFHAIHDR